MVLKEEGVHKVSALPIPVRRVLGKLGQDICDARRRRRIPVALMAERASISRTTLNKVENGHPGVSIGIYASVLFSLGLVNHLAEVADFKNDSLGHELQDEELPKRIRFRRNSPTTKRTT